MNKRLEYKGFLYVVVFFMSFYFLLSSGHFDSIDEVHTFQTARSIMTKGELTTVPILGAVQGAGGKYYTQNSVFPSILIIPFYIAGSFLKYILPENIKALFASSLFSGEYNSLFGGGVLIHITDMFNVVITALLCALYYLFSVKLKFSQKTSFLSAFILGTSTILCYYSKTLFTHTLGCLFLFTAVYLLITDKEKQLNNFQLVLGGVSLSFAVLTRFELIAAVPVFLWYILAADTSFRSGNLKQILYKCSLFLLPVVFAVVFDCFINYIKFRSFSLSGYMGPMNFNGLILEGLYGNLISVGRSIFVYSPAIIISIFYFEEFLQDNKNGAALLIAVSLLFVLLYSKITAWDGSMCWGNRYLLIIIPFLLFPLNYVIEGHFEQRISWPFYLTLLFVILGIFIQVIGMTTLFAYVSIKFNIGAQDAVNGYLFIPDRSQIAMHWQTMLKGEYVDYWLYNIYKNHGLGWMLFFISLPVLCLVLSVRGVLKIADSPAKS